MKVICQKILLSVICVVFLFGCGSSDRQALEGEVTLNGKPLQEGMIRFVPISGTGGPSAGSKIEDGKFLIDSQKGTLAGSFRVEITASRKTGQKMKEPMSGEELEFSTQFLPPRYNRNSELSAEVKPGETNQYKFDLQLN